MTLSHDFTKGPIAGPLFRFALPVMGALLQQRVLALPRGLLAFSVLAAQVQRCLAV